MDRATAAVELLQGHGPTLRRVARRHSICADDADDAVQRASLILLTKAPTVDPGRLIAWMVVVTKHEAMAVRRARERQLSSGDMDSLLGDAHDPFERAARSEAVDDARSALAALKANERLAIVLQAQGYSYAEICDLCGWTYTKVNRLLAEGRARLRAAYCGGDVAGERRGHPGRTGSASGAGVGARAGVRERADDAVAVVRGR